MKYTEELLLEILQEGDAILLKNYPKYNQRLVVEFLCECGEKTSKRFEMLNLYRLPYCEKCSLKKKEIRKVNTCMKKYGVKNTAMLTDVVNKIKESHIKNFGDHPKRVKEVQEKWKATCLEKYGGHPNQNKEVQAKAELNSYKFKDYRMPSGKIVKIQGYEHLALDILIKEFEEEDIIIGRGNVPIIPYYLDTIKHIYFPDFYIKSLNKIIEVKSEWTLALSTAHIEEKAKGVKVEGYDFEVWVFNDKKNLVDKIVL
jgi:hypothetical protein